MLLKPPFFGRRQNCQLSSCLFACPGPVWLSLGSQGPKTPSACTTSTATGGAQERTSPSWHLSQHHAAGALHQCWPVAACRTLKLEGGRSERAVGCHKEIKHSKICCLQHSDRNMKSPCLILSAFKSVECKKGLKAVSCLLYL